MHPHLPTLRLALMALLLLLAGQASAGSCPGTASGGFFLGSFPSDTSIGTTVCVVPAYNRCLSCNYGLATSTCENGDCTLASCYCASPSPGNTPPLAVDDVVRVARNRASVVDVLANDSDAQGDLLAVAHVGVAMHGSAAIVAGRVVYTPDPGYAGVDDFSYKLVDRRDGIDTGHVAVVVTDALFEDGFEP